MGRESEKLINTGTALYTGEKLPPYKKPLIGRFYGETNGDSAVRARYTAALKEMNIAENEAQGFIKEGKQVDAHTAMLASRAKAARSADYQIRKIQKKARQTDDRERRRELEASILEEQKRVAGLAAIRPVTPDAVLPPD